MYDVFSLGGRRQGAGAEVQHAPRQVTSGALVVRVHQQLQDRRELQLIFFSHVLIF